MTSAAAAADWMRPTKKHAKIPLESDAQRAQMDVPNDREPVVLRYGRLHRISQIYTIKIAMTSAAAAPAAAAPAADRIRPTEKHAKIQLDSDVFRPKNSGRWATVKNR